MQIPKLSKISRQKCPVCGKQVLSIEKWHLPGPQITFFVHAYSIDENGFGHVSEYCIHEIDKSYGDRHPPASSSTLMPVRPVVCPKCDRQAWVTESWAEWDGTYYIHKALPPDKDGVTHVTDVCKWQPD